MRQNLQNSINNISLHDNFSEYYNYSHTDIPRLEMGKVGAQVNDVYLLGFYEILICISI